MEDRPPDVPPTVPPYGATPPPPFDPPPAPPAQAPIPWEDPARPKLGAFFETVKLLYSHPRQAFERMPVTSDVLKPYLFGILAGWIGTAVGTVWQMMLRGALESLLRSLPSAPDVAGGDYSFLSSFLRGPVTIAMAPAIVAVFILVGAAFYHLFLMMLGASKGGFAATLRVVCYAHAATLLQIIPACGGPLGGIVSLVFLVVGFSVVHRVSNGRAAAAVLMPVLLCCACAGIAFAIGGAAFLTGLRHAMGR